MTTRIVDRLASRRRHLTFLVGLLVLTFVLAAMLTGHAWWSGERATHSEDARLTDAANVAADEWSDAIQMLMSTEIEARANRLYHDLLRTPEHALQALARDLQSHPPCRDCSARPQTESLFSIDPTGSVERRGRGPSDAALEQLRTEIARANYAPLYEQLSAGVYYVAADGRIDVIVTFVAMAVSADRFPSHLYGFVITRPTAREMLRLAFERRKGAAAVDDGRLVYQSYVSGLPFGEPAEAQWRARRDLAASDDLISGIELTVGFTPRAVVAAGSRLGDVSRDPLLPALLILIAGVITLALLLVRKEAEVARLRADFVSSVTHELRTPLAQIHMFTETLLLGRVRSDMERRRALEIIDQEAGRLRHMIENVLLFSKSEGGHAQPLSPVPTTFAAEVRQAVASFEPMCRVRNVELRAELEENIAADVDRGALRQILVNLLDNALKYGPAGQRITVGVALFGEHARLWVDDEGPGVPEKDRERIFDSFVRLPRDVAARTTGSGIGLAVVRELARLHGGNAWVEPAPGTGARFMIEFPGAYLRTPATPNLAAAS